MIVPSLTQTGCCAALKCANACPFPPVPPNCARPHPNAPHDKQSHRFDVSSHDAQCASPTIAVQSATRRASAIGSRTLCGNGPARALFDEERVFARDDLFFPGFHLGLTGGRERLHDAVRQALRLRSHE